MKLLAEVQRTLGDANIAYCLIGAAALAARGVARSTRDIDLLVLSADAITPTCWDSLRAAGAIVEIHRGDSDDPLRAVIRINRSDEHPVDIIVGRERWQAGVLERARDVSVFGVTLPIAEAEDLVLLKLDADGPQDLWDVQGLLNSARDREAFVATVNARLALLPKGCRETWARILAGKP